VRPVTGLLLLLLVGVLVSVLVNFVTSKPAPPPGDQDRYRSVNDAKFKTLFDAGTKSLAAHQYAEALASFQEAQQTSSLLTDAQYKPLQDARRQIGETYATSGQAAEAEAAYTSMVRCSLQEGQALMQANRLDSAIARFQDAEQTTQNVTTDKPLLLHESYGGLLSCYRKLNRYADAEQVSLRMIDSLRTSADDYDMRFGNTYLDLAVTRDDHEDWSGAEQALLQSVESFDKTIQHFSTNDDPQHLLWGAASSKGYALYNLGLVREREKNIDLALAALDDAFQYSSQFHGPRGESQPYPLKEIAAAGQQISARAQRKDQVDLWTTRLKDLK
jgi:tetratricopeptide (TPR) repeat protein